MTMKLACRAAALSVALFACAPGEPVGHVDLMAAGSSLTVDVEAGDKLRFRTDTEVDMNGLEKGSRGAKGKDALHDSKLAITVKDAKGSATVRCTLFGNIGSSQAIWESKLTETGTQVACEVPITQTGKVEVSGAITWEPIIKPLSAKLEVRRQKKK